MFIGNLYFATLSKIKFFKYDGFDYDIRKTAYSEPIRTVLVYLNGMFFYDVLENKKYTFNPIDLEVGGEFINLDYKLIPFYQTVCEEENKRGITMNLGINPTRRKIKKYLKYCVENKK